MVTAVVEGILGVEMRRSLLLGKGGDRDGVVRRRLLSIGTESVVCFCLPLRTTVSTLSVEPLIGSRDRSNFQTWIPIHICHLGIREEQRVKPRTPNRPEEAPPLYPHRVVYTRSIS